MKKYKAQRTIDHYFRLYFGQPVIYDDTSNKSFGRIDKLNIGNLNLIDYDVQFNNTPYYLLLRPLSEITHEEVLDFVKQASPDMYGDYRYNRWVVEIEIWEKLCKKYRVNRKNSKYFFTVDADDGEILLYNKAAKLGDDGIHPWYREWLYDKGFDVPVWPDGVTLKELGLAVYQSDLDKKTKTV